MSKLIEKQQYETTRYDYEKYAVDFSLPETDLLSRLSRETHFVSTTPGMLSGNLQGLLLKMISQMMQPATILEIGTFTGYSTICLAPGLKPNGILHTIDNNPEIVHIAQKYFRESGFENVITCHLGNALDIIPDIPGPFDLVFIDADKENYVNYYEAVLPKLRSGGVILADNVLWYGKVLEPGVLTDKETRGIVEFNHHVKNDLRIEHLLLPVRDGLMIVRKK
jgi:caffeoyl-CoA O-methyltransferase